MSTVINDSNGVTSEYTSAKNIIHIRPQEKIKKINKMLLNSDRFNNEEIKLLEDIKKLYERLNEYEAFSKME